MSIIGPKCSICCTLLSGWALLMLPIMGGLFYAESIAFVEDMGEPEHKPNSTLTPDELLHHVQEWYKGRVQEAATNCWYACIIYAGTFLFSLWQWWVNFKENKI